MNNYTYSYMKSKYNYMYTYTNIILFVCIHILLINTLINPYDKQHITDNPHGMIDNIKNRGDISKIISLSSFVQLHNDVLSSTISVIFNYILLNLILGYFLIKG